MALIKNNLTKPLCFLTPLTLGTYGCSLSKQIQEAYQNQQKQTKEDRCSLFKQTQEAYQSQQKETKREMDRFCDQFAKPFALVKEKFCNRYSAIAAKAAQGESAIMQLKVPDLKFLEALVAREEYEKRWQKAVVDEFAADQIEVYKPELVVEVGSRIKDAKNIFTAVVENDNKSLQLLQSLVEILPPLKDTFKKERIVVTAAESLENYLEQIVKFHEANKQYGTAFKELMERQRAKISDSQKSGTLNFKEIRRAIAVQVQPIQEEYERKLMEIPLKEKGDLSFELAASLFRAIAEVDKTVGAEEIAQAFIDAGEESKQTGDKLQKQVKAIVAIFQTYSKDIIETAEQKRLKKDGFDRPIGHAIPRSSNLGYCAKKIMWPIREIVEQKDGSVVGFFEGHSCLGFHAKKIWWPSRS